jgi:hypothetical protein
MKLAVQQFNTLRDPNPDGQVCGSISHALLDEWALSSFKIAGPTITSAF